MLNFLISSYLSRHAYGSDTVRPQRCRPSGSVCNYFRSIFSKLAVNDRT